MEDHTLRVTTWRRAVTPWAAISSHSYTGTGTTSDPYIVNWLPKDSGDFEDPMTYGFKYRWTSTMIAAVSTLVVSMGSSMLSAAVPDLRKDFPDHSGPSYVMVTGAYLVGFVLGPIIWAPGSEVFGRRAMFVWTFFPFVVFNAAVAGCKSLNAVLVVRSLAGLFGSSATVNSGGIIADIFEADQRGLAMGVFASAPFLGPAIGPIVSYDLNPLMTAGVLAFVSLAMFIIGFFFLPETYAPVLLRARARKLCLSTGLEYRYMRDVQGTPRLPALMRKQLIMPWKMLFGEPIVMVMSLYMSVIFAILYMQFTSFPIVFRGVRHWSSGNASLPWIGITVGSAMALCYLIFVDNPAYTRKHRAAGGYLAPEARLPVVIYGAILLPIGLLGFAFTCVPTSIHYMVCILFTLPYGAGVLMLFLGLSNYLVDAYLQYAASVLAAAAVLRSIFGVVFPLFVEKMYKSLGVRWASAVPGFIALAFAPAPIVLLFHGENIRRISKPSREADDLAKMMAARARAAAAPVVPTSNATLTPLADETESKEVHNEEEILEHSCAK